jgi:phytoene synthase
MKHQMTIVPTPHTPQHSSAGKTAVSQTIVHQALASDKFWLHPDYAISFDNVRRLTAHFAKSFYFSAQIFPEHQRWSTYAVYGFCRYADNIVDVPRSRTPEELYEEIGALRREIEISYRTGESEHPIIRPFALVARRCAIPIEYALDLLRGVTMDMEQQRYPTFDELYVFCYRVASVVGLMMTYVLGFDNPSTLLYAEKMGVAMQLTNILRDVREDAALGRIYLPQNELEQFGVSEHDILQGNFTTNVQALIRFQVERAHRYYDEAEPGIALLPPQSQFAIYAASKIYRGILHKLEQRAYNPFLGRVFVPKATKTRILVGEVIRTRMFRQRLRSSNV